ncbi:short chain dehydrogenase [Streptomyces shenzhenensis]|uniref:short chain dehydrogenase n=1 Tax=Streptomyces shenzhenensis TaxID=943815 RepID=UPI0033C0D6B8
MRILVIGATGLIGDAVVRALRPRHEVIAVSRSTAPPVDIGDTGSVARLYEQVGSVDGVVVTTGHAPFGRPDELSLEDYLTGVRSKLLGQVDVVRQGIAHLRDGGSFTLTSGILATEPIRGASASAAANGGIEAFARTSAAELPRGQRINVIRPSIVQGSPPSALALFPGFLPVPLESVASAYVRSVEGVRTGHIYEVS